MIDIDLLKEQNLIEDVVEEITGYKLHGRGTYKTPQQGTKEGGLQVNINKQLYFWNSHGSGGDVISFLEHEAKKSFREAVEWLASRAGIPFDMAEHDVKHYHAVRRQNDILTTVAEYLHQQLMATTTALDWAGGRGWQRVTLEQSKCGYWDGNRQGLIAYLQLHDIDQKHAAVKAIMRMPAGMFVYAHFSAGRCCYLSGRAIEDKQHWNMPSDLVGNRLAYFNHEYTGRAKHVVIVEGQADALTLAQWGVAGVALAGVSDSTGLDKQLRRHDNIYLAFDSDHAGNEAISKLADQLGSMTKIVRWPDKDANDWLQNGGTSDECLDKMASAITYAHYLAIQVYQVDKLDRADARRKASEVIATMPDYAYAEHKQTLADVMALKLGQLSAMVKAIKKEEEDKKKQDSDKEEIRKASGNIEGHLFELVHQDGEHGKRTSLAVRYPDGQMRIVSVLETAHYRILPFPTTNPLLAGNVLRLASDLAEYESEHALLLRIQAFIHKYLDVPAHIERLASYYVMLTWLFDSFHVLPYLRARGNSDSGKSRFIETIGELCMRAIFIAGNTTPSPVFRTMSQWNGLTIVMDEADLPHSETSAEWIQMFNTGYKKSFAILRTAISRGEATVEVFSGFGPKILNMRGKFADDATESRCLTWETNAGRGIRDDIERYIKDRDGYDAEAQAIRNQLLTYRLKNFHQIQIDYNLEETKNMPGRLVEITVPLMSITQDGEFKNSIREFIDKMNQTAIMDRGSTLDAKIFEGILRAYYIPDDKASAQPEVELLSIGHITRHANFIIDRENAEGELDDDESASGAKKSLRPHQVGRMMSNKLNLKKERTNTPRRPTVLVWDIERINALIIRFGMEDVVVRLAEKQATRAEALLEKEAAAVTQTSLI